MHSMHIRTSQRDRWDYKQQEIGYTQTQILVKVNGRGSQNNQECQGILLVTVWVNVALWEGIIHTYHQTERAS